MEPYRCFDFAESGSKASGVTFLTKLPAVSIAEESPSLTVWMNPVDFSCCGFVLPGAFLPGRVTLPLAFEGFTFTGAFWGDDFEAPPTVAFFLGLFMGWGVLATYFLEACSIFSPVLSTSRPRPCMVLQPVVAMVQSAAARRIIVRRKVLMGIFVFMSSLSRVDVSLDVSTV